MRTRSNLRSACTVRNENPRANCFQSYGTGRQEICECALGCAPPAGTVNCPMHSRLLLQRCRHPPSRSRDVQHGGGTCTCPPRKLKTTSKRDFVRSSDNRRSTAGTHPPLRLQAVERALAALERMVAAVAGLQGGGVSVRERSKSALGCFSDIAAFHLLP